MTMSRWEVNAKVLPCFWMITWIAVTLSWCGNLCLWPATPLFSLQDSALEEPHQGSHTHAWPWSWDAGLWAYIIVPTGGWGVEAGGRGWRCICLACGRHVNCTRQRADCADHVWRWAACTCAPSHIHQLTPHSGPASWLPWTTECDESESTFWKPLLRWHTFRKLQLYLQRTTCKKTNVPSLQAWAHSHRAVPCRSIASSAKESCGLSSQVCNAAPAKVTSSSNILDISAFNLRNWER